VTPELWDDRFAVNLRKLLPSGVARVVVFLAADESDACTSQSYVVDGAWV